MAELFTPALLQRYPFVERETLLVTRPWLQWLQLLGTTLGPWLETSEAAALLQALSTGTPGVTQATEALAHALLALESRPERLARLEAQVAGLEGALLALTTRLAPVAPPPGLDAAVMLGLTPRAGGFVRRGRPFHVGRYESSGGSLEAAGTTVVDATGRLGVGTTSPSAALHVVLPAAELRLERTAGAGQYTVVEDGGNLGGLRKVGTTAATFLDLNVTNDGTQSSSVRVFRQTTTTGLRGLYIYHGDGSGTVQHRLLVGGGDSFLHASDGGLLGLGTTAPTAPLDVAGATIRLRTARTPASATAAGNVGDLCWDSNFLYVCVAASTWKRAALTTW